MAKKRQIYCYHNKKKIKNSQSPHIRQIGILLLLSLIQILHDVSSNTSSTRVS